MTTQDLPPCAARPALRRSRLRIPIALFGSLVCALAGAWACDGDGTATPTEPVFPLDYQDRWVEVRDCRLSHEHDLLWIRVFADDGAREPYLALDPSVPYPIGATLVKAEYDDERCGHLVQHRAMRKEVLGVDPEGRDWTWQRVLDGGDVVEHGAPAACVTCHHHHCAPPDGYNLTCAEEL